MKRVNLLDDPGPSYTLVTGKATLKGFIRKEVVDFKWDDGDLAQLLNADSDLKNMLTKAHIHNIFIYFNDWHVGKFVDIHPDPDELDRKSFPTRETFQLYDRIAHHLRSIMKKEKVGEDDE